MDSDEKMSSQDFLLQQGLFYGKKRLQWQVGIQYVHLICLYMVTVNDLIVYRDVIQKHIEVFLLSYISRTFMSGSDIDA